MRVLAEFRPPAAAAQARERTASGLLHLVGREASLSTGEVSHLWSFAQGSIMLPEVRIPLRRGWGLCARHAAGWLIVEAAFRHTYLHGPAVLYDELMSLALAAFEVHGPLGPQRVARRLRAHGPCHICAMGVGAATRGFIPEARWHAGRDTSGWRAFMAGTRASWRPWVCGICEGSGAPPRCRAHLCDDVAEGRVDDLGPQAVRVRDIAQHVHRYDRSFRWECQGSDTVQDRAALVAAIGWCGGWQELLALDAARVAA